MTDATTVYQVGVGYGYNTPAMDKQTYENYVGVDVVDRLSDIAGSVVQNAVYGLGIAVANASKALFTGAVTIAVGEIVFGGVSGAAWGFYTGVKSENEDVLRQLQNGTVQKIEFSSYNATDPMKALPTTTNASDGSHTYGVQLVNGQKFYYNDKTNDLRQVGSAGNEAISGGDSNDRINGGGGNDSLYGKDGADVLSGSSGNDTIYGGGGNDVMNGNAGADFMTGGAGSDTFRFTATTAADRNRVTDFALGALLGGDGGDHTDGLHDMDHGLYTHDAKGYHMTAMVDEVGNSVYFQGGPLTHNDGTMFTDAQLNALAIQLEVDHDLT